MRSAKWAAAACFRSRANLFKQQLKATDVRAPADVLSALLSYIIQSSKFVLQNDTQGGFIVIVRKGVLSS